MQSAFIRRSQTITFHIKFWYDFGDGGSGDLVFYAKPATKALSQQSVPEMKVEPGTANPLEMVAMTMYSCSNFNDGSEESLIFLEIR